MGLTKAQLEALNDSSFPNNNAGAITPAILRDYNDAVIGNTVNQDVYSTDSASFDSRIDSLEAFSSSLDANFATDAQLNASSSTLQSNINTKLDTSSFNSYTQSTNNFTASISTSVGLLQVFSSSQYKADSSSFDSRINSVVAGQGLVTTASFNAYTQSNDTKVNNLTNATASYAISSSVKVVTDNLQTQINGLATTSSVNTLSTSVDSRLDALETAGYVTSTITGSSLVTASVSQSTITFTKGNGTQFSITVADVSGSAGNFVTTASFNSYTQSNDTKVNNLNTISASYLAFTQSYYSDSASFDTRIDSLEFSSSTFVTTASLSSLSGSIYSTDATQSSLINGKLDTASFNTFSTSVDSRLDSLELSGSGFATTASVNALSASIYQTDATQSNDITNNSSSFATSISASNFNITNNSASVAITINNLSSSIFQTDATQSNDINSLTSKTGSYATTGSNTFNGTQTINGDISSSGNLIVNTITASAAQITYLHTIYESSSVVYSSGSNQLGDELTDVQILSGSVQVVGGLTLNGVSVSTQSVDLSSLNSFTASQIVSNSYFATTGSNTFTGNQTINADLSVSQSKYLRIGDNQSIGTPFGNSLLIESQGGNLIRNLAGGGNITLENTQGIISISGSGTTIQNVDFIPFSSSLNSRINSITIDTSSLVTTASFNSYTASQNFKNTTFATTASVNSLSASIYQTDSTQSNNIASNSSSIGLLQTFSASADSRYVQNSQTSSMAVSSSTYAVTASYAVSSSLATNAKDIIVEVKNTTGAQINKGTVVRIIGAVGDNALIATASWEDDNNSANTLGFVVSNIANDSFGTVITQGTLLSVDTDPALGYAAGDIVYLSSSGQYTNVIPPAPYHEVRLGQVLRAQQNNGSIYVLIQNGYELTELHDVNIVSASNYDLLAYNSASSQWENKSIGTLGIATTSSVNDLSSSVYTLSQSVDSRLDSLETAGYVTSAITASSLVTASVSQSTITFTKGDGSTFDIVVADISGGASINTGSFATTGSNTFIGDQSISGSVSIINSANGEIDTLKILPYISSSTFNGNRDTIVTARQATSTDGVTYTPSAPSPTNLVFGTIQPTISATSIVSGSNNIITNGRTAATNGAEIEANNSYISVFPSTRTPAYAPVRITNSNLNALLTVTNASVGLSSSLAAGSLGFGNGIAVNVQNSGIFAATTLNPNSASISLNGIFNAGALTVNGNKTGPAFTGGAFSLFSVTNMMNLGTTTLVDIASGSFSSGNTAWSRNLFGGVVTATNILSATASASLQNTIAFGSNLIITGSDGTAAGNGGSAFFGRYNLNDGTINNTSNVVFAVGAGTGTGVNTRTPLWVGTNQSVNITGSVSVSGSSTFNGNMVITGSLTASLQEGYVWVGNASGITTTVSTSSFGGGTIDTASFATTGSNSFNGNQTITGSLIVTGSNLSIDSNANITASTILLTNTGTTAIQYNQPSTGSVNGVYATSYGKDSLKVYQYQGQPYAFNVNLTANQANAYTGSQFEWGLQLNGSNVSLPGGGGTYFAMVSGSTTGSAGDMGADKKGLNYLGTAMILDNYADASFRRKVYVDQGMFVSQSVGGSQVGALTVDGTSATNNRAITATGSVDITGSLTVNGKSFFAPAYGSYTGSTVSSGVMTTYFEEFASGVEIVSSSFVRVTTTGVYQVTATANFDAEGSSGNVNISLKKNGTILPATTISQPFSTNSQIGGVSTTALVQLNAFEYVEVGIDPSDDSFLGGRVSITKIA